MKDDRDVFKSEAAKIKSLAINLLKKSDEKSSGHDLLPLNVSEVESKESSKKEDKSKSSSEDSEREMAEISNNEIDQSQSLFSGSEEGSKSESSNENKIEGENNKSEQKKIKNKNTRFCKEESEENVKETNEVNTGAVAKPLLKVKSFARMTDDNVFSPLKTNTLNGISENNESEQNSETNIKEQDKCDEKVKKKQVDEYNVETDGSSNEEIRLTRKHKSKKKNDLGSNVSDDSSENQHSKRKVKNRKLKETFQRFREKRKQFFKSSSQNDKSVENTQKINQSESSNVLESSEDENDKLRKRSRRRAVRNKIESSEEENVASKSETKISDSESGQNVEETSDSDASSNSEFERSKKKKSTWRRIVKRKARDESSEEKEEDKKKGRKNIKKILKKDSLKVETKEALKNEEERKKRLEERNKLLRELFPENANEENEKDNPKQLILDFDVETKEPLVTVHKKLMSKLKPHQIKGVKFMWDNCFESIKRLEEDSGSGCILAHCMGLGKTLQVVTLIHTTMTHDLGVNTVLIVCPLSIVSNWIKEFEMWLSDIHTESIILYDLLKSKKNEERSFNLEEWHKTGGVMVLSYDLFRNLTKPPTSRLKKKKVYQTFEQTLLDPGPDIVICDEGHLLKNEDTALSKRINQIKTSRRIVLTGTPLQNNLIEYHCMVQFVKPNILGTRKEFMNRFVNPINNGQFEDSTEHDVKVMKRRSHVLHSLLSNCVQRFDYSVLTPFLPEKHEYVLSIALTNVQAKAYQYFINNLSAKASGSSKTATLFHDYHNLQRIWTHPRVIHAHAEREHEKMLEEEDSEGSLKNFVVDSEEEESTSSSPSGSDNSVVEVSNGKRTLRSNAKDKECEEIVEEVEIESNRQRQWWNEFFRDDDLKDIRASNKLIILFSLLKYCTEIEEKVLVFSQSLFSLDLIEHFLCRVDENSDRGDELLAGFNDSWVPGVDYFRLDGTTSSDLRTRWCENFNKNSNKRARLFLISTRAGGLGINLHAANRVVVFDASWNPSHDLQSIFRVYRFGQKKTCYVYRFLAEATMEEKIYERQVTKLSLAHRVVDEHQIERHYSMMNLQELYRYEPTPPENRKTPKLPKDKVLADLLATYKEIIVRYHEHDSLLENQEEEELTEEERKAAWQEFEEEKVQKATAMPLGLLNYQNQLAVMDALKSPQATFPSSVIQGAIRPEALAALRTMVSTGSMPLSIIHRGLRLGLTPLINESVDSFLTRVNNRELLLGNFPRET